MIKINGVNSAGYQIKVYPIVQTARVANDLANRQQLGHPDSRRKLSEQDIVELSQEYREMRKRIRVDYLPEYSGVVKSINDYLMGEK